MKAPKNLQELDCSSKERNLIDDFLLNWGLYYYKSNNLQYWWTVVREMFGIDEEQFKEKIHDFEIHRGVYELLSHLKKCGKRGLTAQEIEFNLIDVINKRNVYKQLEKLKKAKLIKEKIAKFNKHEVKFYYIK